MPVVQRHDVPLVPVRSMFSELPAPPDVYRAVRPLASRWVYYALGLDAQLMHAIRPGDDEADEDVIQALRDMMRDEPRIPALALMGEDQLRASGFSAGFPRLLSLPRPALSLL